MKLLSEIICWNGVRYNQYADDSQLYILTPGQLNNIVKILSQCLETMGIWMGKRILKLILSNTKEMEMYGPSRFRNFHI